MDEMNEMEFPEEQAPAEPQKKKKKWPKVLLIVFLSILALVLVAVIAAAIYVNHLLSLVNYQVGTEHTLSSEQVDEIINNDTEHEPYDPSVDGSIPNIEDLESEITSPSGATDSSGGSSVPYEPFEPTTAKGDIVNILLVGQDFYGNADRGRSDSMILATFNKTTGVITLTSFMRDSYVQIPGYKPHKLNHAYQYGGMSLLNQTLNVNFGVEVDGNVTVDFASFQKIIDMLGGVDITLTETEADYLTKTYKKTVEPGFQRLDGEMALAYSRIRYIDNDYVRASRQRKVLLSLIDRYKTLPVTEMLALLEEVLPLITTNIPQDEIIPLALELFPLLSSSEFATQQIPAEGTFKGGNVQVRPGLKNWFQYNINFYVNRKILWDIFDAEP